MTSGGDAAGMNAAIRAATRTGLDRGWEVFGVRYGYRGLVAGDFRPLRARDVGGILQFGGTVLGSARLPEFKREETRREALRKLGDRNISALIVIGGNGSQTGSHALSEMGFPVVGIASTIDNDLNGSEITLGVDTALNIALEAIDRLKVTASSHQRAFLVETMGRHCGYLALMTGIAGGAEAIVIPEVETHPELIASELRMAYDRGKPHAIVVVAEGAKYHVETLSQYFRENKANLGYDLRTTTLGHIQRGGAPTAYDRVLGTRLGYAAVEALRKGMTGVLTGMIQSKITYTPLPQIAGITKSIDPELFEMAGVLNR